MRTSEVLNKAADLIEERGWVTGTGWISEEHDGAPVCLEGALQGALGLPVMRSKSDVNALSDEIQSCDAGRAIRAYLQLPDQTFLFSWNDRIPTTADRVIEVLRAAALIESAREAQDAAWESYAEQVSV